MDITAMATNINAIKFSNEVGVAVLKKSMDVMKEQTGEMIESIKQMELSVNPNVGANVNTSI